jgi:hypothetical protein
MGIANTFLTEISAITPIQKLYSAWGRAIDRQQTVWTQDQPTNNPDPIDRLSMGERYFKASLNPHIKAAMISSDVSRLFITARGLEADEFGAYHPPQLGYTSPEEGDEAQLNSLAYQYDEQFDGGFQPILKSLLDPAIEYGRGIGEISWQRGDDSKFFADFIYSRDPQEFVFSPPGKPVGLYRKKHIYSTAFSSDLIKMPAGKFMLVVNDPLFNNPYGQSLLRSVIQMVETWQGTGTGYDDDPNQQGVFDAWREGIKKAGFGMWTASYDQSIGGDDNRSVNARAQLLAGVKKLGVRVAGIFPKHAEVVAQKLDMDSAAFMDFFTMYVQTISILMCGSATALTEGKFGSYAKEESTSVREKSNREQMNASMLSLAFTYQFNRFWLHYNYGKAAKALPQLQLIPPDRIMPTTPQGQDTAEEETIEIDSEKSKDDKEDTKAKEFQEEEGSEVSLDTREEPDIYFQVQAAAKDYLEKLPVKPYKEVKPSEAANVYTVKSLQSRRDSVPLLTALKNAIIPTLSEKTEAKAWEQYRKELRGTLKSLNFTVSISNLMISFRQARQAAFQAGIDKLAKDRASDLVAIRIETREDSRVRGIHKRWHGVTMRPGDKRLEKLKCPMDFGCRCNQIPVFRGEQMQITPEDKIPTTFPGQTYKNYVRA